MPPMRPVFVPNISPWSAAPSLRKMSCGLPPCSRNYRRLCLRIAAPARARRIFIGRRRGCNPRLAIQVFTGFSFCVLLVILEAGFSVLFRGPIMFKRILIPTDGSPLSAQAANKGVCFARQLGAEIVALYVTQPFAATVGFDGMAAAYAIAAETYEKKNERTRGREGVCKA